MTTKLEVEGRMADVQALPRSGSWRSDRLYAYLREHWFRDDTDRIDAALWPDGPPTPGSALVEIGCGPGTYARRLAGRHPELRVIGIDRSHHQVDLAIHETLGAGLENCYFEVGDAERLPLPNASVDAVVASRLLMVLGDPERAIAEVHRILRPGGRYFVAEPRPGVLTALPSLAMHLVDGISGAAPRSPDDVELADLLGTQPWSCVIRSDDERYRYAVCQRSGE